LRQDPGRAAESGGRTKNGRRHGGHDVRVLLSAYAGRGDEPLVSLAVRVAGAGCGGAGVRARPTGAEAAGRLVRGKATRAEDVPNTRFRQSWRRRLIRSASAVQRSTAASEVIAVSEQQVLGLQEVDEMQVAVVGGKGRAPGGACRGSTASACRPAFAVTTDALPADHGGKRPRSTIGSISCRA